MEYDTGVEGEQLDYMAPERDRQCIQKNSPEAESQAVTG